ncbi:dTMP kinase [Halorhabdus sp. BNX81]|uniref:dTMP kinase n=1 Tax=Halorhabdus sp. BNX81 TaxID=2980181 RepID=UPI0023DD58DB|nr:dTMP kinase [Halorhabdus sp. BNX81]WEL20390.1 Thymidylate kinase [Halorhabdus sp. BNX81]
MLITLEGIDGSGKSSAWKFLREHTADLDPDFTFTREPTESWYGEAVQRSIQEDDADSLAELFLYTADHAAHLADTVQPALDRGEVVVSDRYSDSRYAYQGATLADRLDDPLAFVREIHEPWTRPPDATIYLDVDAETGAERSGGTNKFERVEHLRSVRENYEALIAAEPDRFVRIDATRAAEAVRADVLEAVERLLSEQ